MAKSMRDKLMAATYDSSARGRMGSGGIKRGDKVTAPPQNKTAKSIPSKGTKATGIGASKTDPRPSRK